MTEAGNKPDEGKLPFVITFSYTERLVGQMLAYATSLGAVELEIGEEFRAFIPDFKVEDAQEITAEEEAKIKAGLAEAEKTDKKLN